MDENTIHLTAKIDTSEMDEVTRKAERLTTLLKEANSLVDELASKGGITLSVEVENSAVSTSSLVQELSSRDGVEVTRADPYKDIQINVNGPAVALVVTD